MSTLRADPMSKNNSECFNKINCEKRKPFSNNINTLEMFVLNVILDFLHNY